MDHAAHSERLRWQRNGEPTDEIASIMLPQLDWLTSAVKRLFKHESVPDSGIVISNDHRLADGGRIEKNCYHKGGYVFLVRPSGGMIEDVEFPVARLVALLESVGSMFLRDVVGALDVRAALVSCWAVCQRDGDYGTIHNHIPPDGADDERYSGMLYLETPASITPSTFPNGCLHLVTWQTRVVYVPPIPGSICFWPSELLHGIHPFRGSGDRLGVAFDISARKER